MGRSLESMTTSDCGACLYLVDSNSATFKVQQDEENPGSQFGWGGYALVIPNKDGTPVL